MEDPLMGLIVKEQWFLEMNVILVAESWEFFAIVESGNKVARFTF